MARKLVKNYAVFENVDGATSINFYYTEGGADTLSGLSSEESAYMIDILRNEKPVSYDHERKRISTYHPEPVGEAEGGFLEPFFNLEYWLNQRPYIRDFINWELPGGASYNYRNWTVLEKSQLTTYYYRILRHLGAGLSATPTLASTPGPSDVVSTALNRNVAWEYYLAHVAQSLVTEADIRVNWRMQSYSDDEKRLLLDSKSLFAWNSSRNAYVISFDLGAATPGDPYRTYTFLLNNNLLGASRLDTVIRLIDWCRRMVHFTGGWEASNIYDQWQYYGFPPVERIISGTPVLSRPGDPGRHRTGGCWGTTGFLRAVLRTVNIPVELVTKAGHALPHFISERRYLSHGDDPYNQLFGPEPTIPASRLPINQATFDSWFGPGVSHLDHIGRQTRELALEFLPNYVLRRHCEDLAAGRGHAESRVFEIFERNYTVAQLEGMNLWERIEDKIDSLGGCGMIP